MFLQVLVEEPDPVDNADAKGTVNGADSDADDGMLLHYAVCIP